MVGATVATIFVKLIWTILHFLWAQLNLNVQCGLTYIHTLIDIQLMPMFSVMNVYYTCYPIYYTMCHIFALTWSILVKVAPLY